MEDINIVIGDAHLGRNSNNLVTFSYTQRFLVEQIYQTCLNYQEKEQKFSVTFMGDTFHSESLISSYIASRISKFIKSLSSLDCCTSIIFLVGNHDTWTKDSNDENASNIFISNHKVKIVYEYDVLTTPSGSTCLMVSHCADETKFLKYVSSDSSDYIFMHQEIQGFLYKGEDSISLINPDLLKKYKRAFNGHIHAPSSSKNIIITGSIEQNNFGEEGNITGYFVVFMDTNKNIFIPNTISPIYKKYKYADIKEKSNEQLEDLFSKQYVRIYCANEEEHFDCQFLIKDVESALNIKPIKLSASEDREVDVEEHELRSIADNIRETAHRLTDSLKGKEFKGFKVDDKLIISTKNKIDAYHEKLKV